MKAHCPAPKLRQRLLTWYTASARDLPWRRTKDPYKIWISEIMLQQTQVETVIPYYRRWLRRFPTLKSLAQSPLEDVLRLWAGLGYYRRARMLHKASQEIVKDHAGKLPETVESLMKLSGIGRYTAGAIASIAFGKPEPVLDGNVKRVLSRVFSLKDPVDTLAAEKKLWALARELVTLPGKRHPGDLNQALMELGAMVCLPKSPQCAACPVTRNCSAREEGRQGFYPVKKRKEKLEALERFALVARDGRGRVLLKRQPPNGRWGGLWMFPHWDVRESMFKETGILKKDVRKLAVIRHGFTRYQVHLNVYEQTRGRNGLLAAAEKGEQKSLWVPLKEVKKYALPAPHQTIARALKEKP